MSSVGAASRAAVSVSSARAAASRKNGARSRGPKTADGKARSAQNALKHGLRAQKHVVLPDEDGGEFRALEAALIEELSPVGALQAVLAQRVAVAAWRLRRADRIEAELLGHQQGRDGDLGLAVIRDANGAGALPTLLRYRGSALAEFTRSLRALKALQAEARAQAGAGAEARAPASAPLRLAAARPAAAAQRAEPPAARAKQPDEPERRGDPGERGRPADRVHQGGAP
ncbi:MAG: hypothetical protein K0R41_3666, partial [Geminicoccaceae bacterium]|nr:hypothetical protein [Geminicoccaceae bacterium]